MMVQKARKEDEEARKEEEGKNEDARVMVVGQLGDGGPLPGFANRSKLRS
jgi:hypothetical protein